MNKTSNHFQPWRVLWLFPVAVLATLSIIATGGGGSGSNGDIDFEPPLIILPNYNFFLANLNNGDPLTVVVGNEFTVTVDIDGLLPGNLDLNVGVNDTVTFLSYLIRSGAGIFITVTSPEGSPLDGTFSVNVTSDIVATVGDAPTSGVFGVADVAFAGATVTILANGVEVSVIGGKPIAYTWDDFTDLIDDEQADAWLRRAALASGALEFIIEQFFSVADLLDELEPITFNNPFVATCDMFTGAPPNGVLAQGEFTVTWLGSGELADGDDFTWQFEQCWDQDDEELIHGTITLEDYTESVDFNTGVLFDIGFGGLGAGAPGGVIFDFTISETVESDGVWTIPAEGVISVSGGFVLNIQRP